MPVQAQNQCMTRTSLLQLSSDDDKHGFFKLLNLENNSAEIYIQHVM